jgi:hypothetical protein
MTSTAPAVDLRTAESAVERLASELMDVHHRLCRNGPSGSDGGLETANRELRVRLVELHSRLREAAAARDRALFG